MSFLQSCRSNLVKLKYDLLTSNEILPMPLAVFVTSYGIYINLIVSKSFPQIIARYYFYSGNLQPYIYFRNIVYAASFKIQSSKNDLKQSHFYFCFHYSIQHPPFGIIIMDRYTLYYVNWRCTSNWNIWYSCEYCNRNKKVPDAYVK